MTIFRLVHDTARRRAVAAVQAAPEGYVVRISPPTRSLEANALLWSKLADVSRQVVWHGRKLSPDDWKIIFTAALSQLVVVPNLDGTGFVALGNRTSTMSKARFSELVALVDAFGDERGVKWTLSGERDE